jgi:hypothetical protein
MATMQMWRAVLLLNLALAVGLGLGYSVWGRRLEVADTKLKTAEVQIEQIERERDSGIADGHAGEQLWAGRGVVRAVFPRLIIITHEDIAGLLPARTTSFRLADTADRGIVRPGASIRFWLLGATYDSTVLVRTAAW